MNWEFIIKYLPTYERAAWLTLRIGVAGIVAAIVLGLVCAHGAVLPDAGAAADRGVLY